MMLVGSWVVVPRAIQTLTAPKYRRDVGVETPPYTVLAAFSVRLLTLAVLAWCALVIVEAVKDRPRHGVGALILLLMPWMYLELRDLTLGSRPSFSTAVYFAVVLALWALRPSIRQLAVLGYLVGLVAVVSMLIGFLLPLRGTFRHADGVAVAPEKALLPGGLLVGIFTHGNNLGQFLVLGLPMVVLIRHVAVRVFLVLCLVYALTWSAARSSLVTLLLLVVGVTLLAVIPVAWRAFPLCLGLVGLYATVVALPLVTTDPLAFTNRGHVWLQSLQVWHLHRFIGSGSHFYREVAQSSGALGPTVYHGHNQLVQLLVTGGLCLAALVAALLVFSATVAVREAKRSHFFSAAYLIVLAGVCILEVSLSFVDNTFLLPVMVVPLAVILFADPSERDSRIAPTESLTVIRESWSTATPSSAGMAH